MVAVSLPPLPEENLEASARPWDENAAQFLPSRLKMNPGKVKRVAEILGLSDDDEEEILVRLIDEFHAMYAGD